MYGYLRLITHVPPFRVTQVKFTPRNVNIPPSWFLSKSFFIILFLFYDQQKYLSPSAYYFLERPDFEIAWIKIWKCGKFDFGKFSCRNKAKRVITIFEGWLNYRRYFPSIFRSEAVSVQFKMEHSVVNYCTVSYRAKQIG